MPYINKESIRRKLTTPSKKMDLKVQARVEKDIGTKTDKLIELLKEHEVSAELEGDGGADGSSFLDGRSGNLRALIGFYEEDDPVAQLEKLLREGTYLKRMPPMKTVRGFSINYRFSVQLPSMASLYEATPYPDDHTTGSWLRGIEKGIPGLRYYLFSTDAKKTSTFKNSRSGYAIQAKTIIRASPSKMSGVRYISEILEKFKRKFDGGS